MKVKIVKRTKDYHFWNDRHELVCTLSETDGVQFEPDGDVRWINVYGYEISEPEISLWDDEGKIIGDN